MREEDGVLFVDWTEEIFVDVFKCLIDDGIDGDAFVFGELGLLCKYEVWYDAHVVIPFGMKSVRLSLYGTRTSQVPSGVGLGSTSSPSTTFFLKVAVVGPSNVDLGWERLRPQSKRPCFLLLECRGFGFRTHSQKPRFQILADSCRGVSW